MQRQLLTVQQAQAEKVQLLNPVLLKTTKSAQEAFRQMVAFSEATHESLGASIKKPRETVTRFVNGSAGLTPNKLVDLIAACNNIFFLQYMAERFGYELTPIDRKAQRKAELLAELDELEQAA